MNKKNLTSFNDLVNYLEKVENIKELELIQELPDFFGKEVVKLSSDSKGSETEEGKNLINKASFVRKFGAKFFDMFRLEINLSFCGVTIFHFVIPKVSKSIK